jgi:succinate dehydrogenase/fumarate reductase flavoprotein subunit
MNISDKLEQQINLKVEKFDALIVGSGAAGLNCALHLVQEGAEPSTIAVITEKLGGGTSFNTGSDKQTYYKMSIIGDQRDCPYEMAKDYYNGGAMHGDIALIEATNSIHEFFHLVHLGVPFPHDKYGGYVGYKTDYDPRQRATSIGPLTSQKMCECLLKVVKEEEIKIFDFNYVMEIITNGAQGSKEAVGLIALDIKNLSNNKNIDNLYNSIKFFQAKNIILATGGPAALYKYSVYPKSQWGGMSLAIKAGCKMQNLTESQFGLASLKFQWNLSGSYQQVIPRYFSENEEGQEKEFLNQYFKSFSKLSKAIFLKGYQWPFNAERIDNQGSSLIDLAVYYEREILGRKVFLDYTRNPLNYEQVHLDPLVKEYLLKSDAFQETPIGRLIKLNKEAFHIYKTHGIDLYTSPIEIAVCNQHLNGGVSGNIRWESNIAHLFAIGEVNGTHGIHRPGGAALNSGQVGGLRAAQKIANTHKKSPYLSEKTFLKLINLHLGDIIEEFKMAISNEEAQAKPKDLMTNIRERMNNCGSIIRPLNGLDDVLNEIRYDIQNYPSLIRIDQNSEFIEYLKVKDALLTQYCILGSILNYHKSFGRSRGSYLTLRDSLHRPFKERYIIPPGNLSNFKFIQSENSLKNKIQTVKYSRNILEFNWEKVREIPQEFESFEHVWKKHKNNHLFK